MFCAANSLPQTFQPAISSAPIDSSESNNNTDEVADVCNTRAHAIWLYSSCWEYVHWPPSLFSFLLVWYDCCCSTARKLVFAVARLNRDEILLGYYKVFPSHSSQKLNHINCALYSCAVCLPTVSHWRVLTRHECCWVAHFIAPLAKDSLLWGNENTCRIAVAARPIRRRLGDNCQMDAAIECRAMRSVK